MKFEHRRVAVGAACVIGAAVSLYAFGAAAHGKHKRGVWVENHTHNEVQVAVYNGDDKVCQVPHSVRTVKAGAREKVKCHTGQNNKCKIGIEDAGYHVCAPTCTGIKRAETAHVRREEGKTPPCVTVRRD